MTDTQIHTLCAGRTDAGRVRTRNEDAILVRGKVGLWVVADGMGGHSAGEVASNMIVKRLDELMRPANPLEFVEMIEDCIDLVNRDLLAMAVQQGVDLIGSTLVLCVQCPEYMLCGWVGDSRCYCFEDGALRQITRDHSQANEDQNMQFGTLAGQPPAGAGMLTRAVGAEDALFMEWVVTTRSPDQQFLLCSDGINKEISDTELEAEFRRNQHPQDLLDSLFDLALNRGARDNISAIVVRLGE